jgi:hemerythrin-like domain-containing protein
MPVTIGTAENSFTNPIGLLSDCHRRIERFLHALQQVTAEVHGRPLEDKYRTALEAALNYFRHAAPRHTADEEDDLFPLLRSLMSPGMRETLAHVDRLKDEHRIAAELHRKVDELATRWLRQDCLSEPESAQLEKVLAALADLYRSHIAMEEREVFPLAQQLLAQGQREALGRRMASRRGVPFMAGPGGSRSVICSPLPGQAVLSAPGEEAWSR